jgi:hypothetical protein
MGDLPVRISEDIYAGSGVSGQGAQKLTGFINILQNEFGW